MHGRTGHQAGACHADLPRRRRRRARAARRQPDHRARRIRRHHGLVGLRQVDADGDPRLPRPADQRPLLLRRRRRRGARRAGAARASAASGSASCSRASICWRAPAPSRTSRCRCSTPRPGRPGSASRFERARAALELLGLGERERNTPGQLSGGQQQRVAIARALINTPSVLLADEPTGNLDTRTSHEIMQTLRRLNREQGVTIIVVTHEPDIAAYADRIGDDARRRRSSPTRASRSRKWRPGAGRPARRCAQPARRPLAVAPRRMPPGPSR